MSHATQEGSPRTNQQSTAELVKQAADQASHLIKDEIRLLRAELNAKRSQAGMGAGMLGVAGVLAGYAVAALLATAILALALVLPAWLAALIVAVALLLIAAVLALVGRASLKRAVPPMPSETVASVKADIDQVKERAHR